MGHGHGHNQGHHSHEQHIPDDRDNKVDHTVRVGTSAPVFEVGKPVSEDKDQHPDIEKNKQTIEDWKAADAATATKVFKDVPGENEDEQGVEAEVSVVAAPDPFPLVPEEAGDDGMLEKSPVFLAVAHVPEWFCLR